MSFLKHESKEYISMLFFEVFKFQGTSLFSESQKMVGMSLKDICESEGVDYV